MTPNDWPGRSAAESSRQWPTLEALCGRADAIDSIEGLILLGSFASGTPDEISDIDVIVVAAAGRFHDAWAERHRLSENALVSWDLRPKPDYEIHNWLTRDMIKIDCTIVDPDSGSKELADPFAMVVGSESIAERFPRIATETVREHARRVNEEQQRQVFDPNEMDDGELIDWKIAELKHAVRRALRH